MYFYSLERSVKGERMVVAPFTGAWIEILVDANCAVDENADVDQLITLALQNYLLYNKVTNTYAPDRTGNPPAEV